MFLGSVLCWALQILSFTTASNFLEKIEQKGLIPKEGFSPHSLHNKKLLEYNDLIRFFTNLYRVRSGRQRMYVFAGP